MIMNSFENETMIMSGNFVQNMKDRFNKFKKMNGKEKAKRIAIGMFAAPLIAPLLPAVIPTVTTLAPAVLPLVATVKGGKKLSASISKAHNARIQRMKDEKSAKEEAAKEAEAKVEADEKASNDAQAAANAANAKSSKMKLLLGAGAAVGGLWYFLKGN